MVRVSADMNGNGIQSALQITTRAFNILPHPKLNGCHLLLSTLALSEFRFQRRTPSTNWSCLQIEVYYLHEWSTNTVKILCGMLSTFLQLPCMKRLFRMAGMSGEARTEENLLNTIRIVMSSACMQCSLICIQWFMVWSTFINCGWDNQSINYCTANLCFSERSDTWLCSGWDLSRESSSVSCRILLSWPCNFPWSSATFLSAANWAGVAYKGPLNVN